ncbi:hypothetical protein [Halopseudomonas maritima]|uniref:hypothetical protein n=1 Tax=Halopseudomonas maritima TaxID=2918528 RepID=UPI001EEC0581|nr:hypothetical protein [Halopseudomonas maritima]UJJ32952.1 hypothetical protein HV822_07355 [Halopseudomonas maritima]
MKQMLIAAAVAAVLLPMNAMAEDGLDRSRAAHEKFRALVAEQKADSAKTERAELHAQRNEDTSTL